MGMPTPPIDSFLELPDNAAEIFAFLDQRYARAADPWGLERETIKASLKILWPLYRHYFQVRLFGAEKVLDRPVMLVANHTGQIAMDGVLLYCAFLTQVQPPRVMRAMVERFVTRLPFMGSLFAQGGAVLGDRQNCQYLIEHGESLMVFPEGVRGIAKNTRDFYKVQAFSKGFYRMALIQHTPIIPCAIIGCEEMYPYVYQPRDLARRLGIPALPLSASFLMGPLGLLPLPSPVDIVLGDPILPPAELDADAPDKAIEDQVAAIQATIQGLVRQGLKTRRPFKERVGLPDQREV